MFRYISQYAETIDHVDIYPMVSLFIFFLFFVVLLYGVKRMGKEKVRQLSEIPFDNEEITISTF